MRVRAPVREFETMFGQRGREILRVLHDPPLQLPEPLRPREVKRDGHRRELVHVRPPLLAGEHGRVHRLRSLLVRGQDDRAAGAAQSLVRGEGDHVRDAHRARTFARDHESRGMRDVRHQHRADRIRDLPERVPVRRPRIGGVSRDDELGAMLLREPPDRVVIQPIRNALHPVGHDPVPPTGHIELTPVREMPAVQQIHPHQRVARL